MEAREDFWIMSGEFIYGHQAMPREQLCVPKESSSSEAGLLQVEVDAVSVSVPQPPLGSSGLNGMTISTSEPTYSSGPTDNHEAAESVDCQMVGANGVGQQLNVQTDGSQSCKGINQVAEQTAFWLNGTVAGVLLGEGARLVLPGRLDSGGQYRPSVLGCIHQLDRDLGLSAFDVLH